MATKATTKKTSKPKSAAGFEVVKRTDINNPDFDYEAVLTTEVKGKPYSVGIMVKGTDTYKADKAAAELADFGIEVSPEFLADLAVAG